MQTFLEFERPIAELEGKIEELRHLSDAGELNIADEVGQLQGEAERVLQPAYSPRSVSSPHSVTAKLQASASP